MSATKKEEKYVEAVGRRKTATARVRLYEAKKSAYTVNDKEMDAYFPTDTLRAVVKGPLAALPKTTYKIEARVSGGGASAQAEAVRHGIARALVKDSAERRKDLKVLGYLKRDPRMKERKKFGLKSARRAPQWSKR
ncbi:MAG: 30S ribosomal protein S9 [bacterium]|nr:30S ribosomal protein S9 [bacterium]